MTRFVCDVQSADRQVVCLLQADGLDLGELGVQEAAARRGVLPDGEHPAAQAPDSAVLARLPAP